MSLKADTARALTLAALLALSAAPPAAAQETDLAAGRDETSAEHRPPVRWDDVEIVFEGNEAYTDKELAEWTKYCAARRTDQSEWFSLRALEHCLRNDVREYVSDFGRVRAKFGPPQVAQAWPGLRVSVTLEEGRRYRLGEVRFEGAKYFTAEKLLATFPLQKGDFPHDAAFTAWLVRSVKLDYESSGFVQFAYEVEPQYTDGPEPGSEGVVDYNVKVSEGPQFVLRGVEFKGDLSTPHDRLRRMIRIRDGEVFNRRRFEDGLVSIENRKGVEDIDREKDVVYRTDAEAADIFVVISLKEKQPDGT